MPVFFFKNLSPIEYFQPVIFKPPKWLVIMTWLAAFSGRGSAGRALLLSSSESGSIGIRLKDGKEVFIVVTDQMCKTALKGFQEIIKALTYHKVMQKSEVREIRSMGMEILR